MEVITIDGQKFVKASVAARQAGYTADYVGQLARSGAVPARLIGRTWYVDPDILRTHRVEKKRAARLKAREQVQQAIAERQTRTGWETRAVSSSYEPDQAGLIPEIKPKGTAAVSVANAAETPTAEKHASTQTYRAVSIRPVSPVRAEKSPVRTAVQRQVIAPRRDSREVAHVTSPKKQMRNPTRTRSQTEDSGIRTSMPVQARTQETRRGFPLFGTSVVLLSLVLALLLPIFEVREVYEDTGDGHAFTTEYVINIGSLISNIRRHI